MELLAEIICNVISKPFHDIRIFVSLVNFGIGRNRTGGYCKINERKEKLKLLGM